MNSILRSLIVLIFVALTCSGCYIATPFFMEGLTPGQYSFSPEIQKITVIPRMDLSVDPQTDLVYKNGLSSYKNDSLLINETIVGWIDAMSKSPRFVVSAPLVERQLSKELSEPVHAIPWWYVDSLLRTDSSDALLVLEACIYTDTLMPQYDYNLYQIKCSSIWRFYERDDRVIKSFIQIDTLFEETEKGQLIQPQSQHTQELYRALSYRSGYNLATLMSPLWEELERYCFGFPDDFYLGLKMMEEEKYDDALQFWQKAMITEAKWAQACAAWNMAVTLELKGDFTNALEWIKKSRKLGMPNEYVTVYTMQLKERIDAFPRLTTQMNDH